jgi:ERF superfamily
MTLKEKLHSVYQTIDFIEKGGENTSQHYKYIKSADVVRNVRAALIAVRVYAEINFDFVGVPYTISRAKEPNAPFSAVNVKCSVVLEDLDSNEKRTGSGLGTGCDTSDKAVYKAQTGSLKYALKNAFLIPDEADPEADSSVDEPAEPVRRAAPTSVPKAERPTLAASGATAAAGSPAHASTGEQQEPRNALALVTAAAEAMADEDGTLPTEEQMTGKGGFSERFRKFCTDMSEVGKLKSSKNLPVNRKIVVFLLSIAGVDDAKNITVAQWENFFARVDAKRAEAGGLAQLTILVNKVNGVEEKK